MKYAVAIPSSVKKMGEAFSGCKNLTGSITMYCVPTTYDKAFDGCGINKRYGVWLNYTFQNRRIVEKMVKRSTGNVRKGMMVSSFLKY